MKYKQSITIDERTQKDSYCVFILSEKFVNAALKSGYKKKDLKNSEITIKKVEYLQSL